MPNGRTTSPAGGIPLDNPPATRRPKRVLVVDPEELVRWSVVTYLAKWFSVYSATTTTAADGVLDSEGVDALVLSEDLPGSAAEEIEAHARARNPDVVVIRTVTGPPHASKGCSPGVRLEKPFELSRLAELLGVGDATKTTGPGEPPSSQTTV